MQSLIGIFELKQIIFSLSDYIFAVFSDILNEDLRLTHLFSDDLNRYFCLDSTAVVLSFRNFDIDGFLTEELLILLGLQSWNLLKYHRLLNILDDRRSPFFLRFLVENIGRFMVGHRDIADGLLSVRWWISSWSKDIDWCLIHFVADGHPGLNWHWCYWLINHLWVLLQVREILTLERCLGYDCRIDHYPRIDDWLRHLNCTWGLRIRGLMRVGLFDQYRRLIYLLMKNQFLTPLCEIQDIAIEGTSVEFLKFHLIFRSMWLHYLMLWVVGYNFILLRRDSFLLDVDCWFFLRI